MGKLLLATIILSSGVVSLARPWIGICAYYLLSIFGPQYIWWWNFQGLRVSLIIALCTIAGIALKYSRGEYDFSTLKTKLNAWMLVLWLAIVVSYYMGAYSGLYFGSQSDRLFSITNTIFFFYFCASLEIDDISKLRYLMIVFAVSTIYLTYWANSQYLNQAWSQFNSGRLMGPSSPLGAIYKDENAFAMLFVAGTPFIYYLGWQFKRIWMRLGLWLIIPLAWHAIFLTGSRGGLLGIGIVVLSMVFLSKRRMMAIPLLLVFLVFFQWQAGNVMQQRSDAIVDIEGENSAGDRITAWKGGAQMLMEHPLTGVGLGNFVVAIPDFAESRKMVAHNTAVQFFAESGFFAGTAYLMLIFLFFRAAKEIRGWCREHRELDISASIDICNNASLASFSGLVVCSMFLSLNTYEIFFVLLLMNNSLLQICRRKTLEKMNL